MKIHVADAAVLNRLLARKKRRKKPERHEVDFGEVLSEVLRWANRFVPSQSGSILLDDPVLKLSSAKKGRLVFAACFGKGAAKIVGSFLPEIWGIAGETYRSGTPYISKDVGTDSMFCSKIDEQTRIKTRSIICAPIFIEDSIIGVIELINSKNKIKYAADDLSLLKIFAGYTATLVHNAIIARSFEELSKRDDLTGLYNDRHFFRSLEAESARVSRSGGDLSLIFFDLDRFKEVNDTHGHLAGSMVLRETADILRGIFRSTDAVVSRYGGDEYVVVLPEMALAEAASYAEKIRAAISDNVYLSTNRRGMRALDIRGVITCSVGVASLKGRRGLGKNARDAAEALIRAADRAMYTAKESGRNRVAVEGGRAGK